MIKMKSERPLLINGTAQTEFETTEQHGKELVAAGLAELVEPEPVEREPVEPVEPVEPEPEVEGAPAKSPRSKKQP